MEQDLIYDILQLIPMGYVTTYKALGNFLGLNQRKVAQLLRKNKNPIIVPCHRVIMSNGDIGGYTPYGKEFKKTLLEAEGVPVNKDKVSKDKIIYDIWSFILSYY